MSLIDESMTACTLLVQTPVNDGQFGAPRTWTDGEAFDASIVNKATAQTRVAGAQDVSEGFTVTVYKGRALKFHDVFRRESDGAIFRVTSNTDDSETPARASFQVAQVSAERWVLPT